MGCLSVVDYDTLLDDEVRAFIARTQTFYPDDATDLTIGDNRRVYEMVCAAFATPHPDSVTASDTSADGVPVRVYQAGEPTVTVLYIHGGGFVLGGLESHDSICADVCGGTGYRVVSVDYRLAPEHLHPAAFEDCKTAALWTIRSFDGPIVLAGDSAGGSLAASVAHALRGVTDQIRGQMLIYPILGAPWNSPSYVAHTQAPGLTRSDVQYYEESRLAGPMPTDDPTYEPLQDRDFSALPPTVIISADCDPLADDGRLYRDALAAAGNTHVHWLAEPGLVHGYLRARNMSSKARDSFDRIVTGIQCLGQGLWPYD